MSRFRPFPRRLAIVVCVAAAAMAARLWWPKSTPQSPETLAEGEYEVARVIDGDTLLLTNDARVRLIGVDTPETVAADRPVQPWGPEATAFTREFVADGQVRLEFDRERLDVHGRFLAFVWVGERMLNEELLRAGLARADLRHTFGSAFKTRFRRVEEQARAARLGIWSGDAPLHMRDE